MTAARDNALDMVKGLMVIGMLLYHTAALMPAGQSLMDFLYLYPLGFISGSWVFIAGFLVTHLNRERFAAAAGQITRRTCTRGLRLVAIFAIANILLGKLTFSCPGGLGSGDCAWWAVFVRGENARMTYEIIQGIGYVLVIAPLFLLAPAASMAATLLALVGASAAAMAGLHFKGLYFGVLMGAAGLSAGHLLPAGTLPRVLSEPGLRRNVTSVALAGWVFYEATMYFVGNTQKNAGIYLVGVVCSLMLLYIVSGSLTWRGGIGWCMRLMAAYSLVCYMGQMLILKAWYVLVGDLPVLSSYVASVAAAFALMIGAVALLDRARRRLSWVDRGYRFAFG